MKLHLIRGLRLTSENLIVIFSVQYNTAYFFITLTDKRIINTWIGFKIKEFVSEKFWLSVALNLSFAQLLSVRTQLPHYEGPCE